MDAIWDVSSLLEYQFFCCPGCDFRHQEKQLFVDHAATKHSDKVRKWQRIKDGSLDGIQISWNNSLLNGTNTDEGNFK